MNRNKGFTLIEVMIAVAIVGILAAVAIPSYQNHVRKTYRLDCQAALEGLANAMERHYTRSVPSSYSGAAESGADEGAPSIFAQQAPLDGGTKACDLTISDLAADGMSYELTATPISGSLLDGDGSSTLTSAGTRCWYEDGGSSCESWGH